MGAGACKNGGETFRKKVHYWKIPQGFLKKTEGFDKKTCVLEATSLSYPTQNIAWGYQCQKGGYGIPNNMSLV